VAEDTTDGAARPKLHGMTTLTRLTGAGVTVRDLASASTPDRVSLLIGDSVTNVALDGTLTEVEVLIVDAAVQLSHLRGARTDRQNGRSQPETTAPSVPPPGR
jgi:hypothetical protein